MNIGLIILLSSIMLGQAVIFLPTFHEKLFILLSKPKDETVIQRWQTLYREL